MIQRFYHGQLTNDLCTIQGAKDQPNTYLIFLGAKMLSENNYVATTMS